MKKHRFLISLLALSVSTALQAESFWKTDLHENLTNVTKVKGQNYFTVDEVGKPWPGVGPNGEAAGTVNLYYSRIPALVVTDDDKLVAMFDLRWNNADDHDRIDPGVAISSDGGHSWLRKTAWTFDKSKQPKRRAMDATLLYNNIDGTIYALHGTWSDIRKVNGTGSANWYQSRHAYYNDGVWEATIYKSTDGGENWQKVIGFDRDTNVDIFSKVKKNGGGSVIGFLGGVGSGIVMRDGTLVFPIQTAHNNGIATTILYSKDNGKTWDMPATDNALAPNQISLENMVFELGDKLVMTGRENRVNGSQAGKRWAYYTQDLGKTWLSYPQAEFGSSTAQPTQGSSIYVTLPSGRRVLLVSKPNGNGNDGYKRGNLALWMLDAKDSTHVHQVTLIRPGSGNQAGGGIRP